MAKKQQKKAPGKSGGLKLIVVAPCRVCLPDRVIDVNEHTPQKELLILYERNHPSVKVAELDTTPPAEEVKTEPADDNNKVEEND